MKDLEQLLENLLTAVMQQARNVEEVLYCLHAFYHYSMRETMYPIFEKQTIEMWSMFMQGIHAVKKELVEESNYRPMFTPLFGGRAIIAHLKRRKLIALKQVSFKVFRTGRIFTDKNFHVFF